MPSSDQKVVFGVSIATIVLSALAILGLLLCAIVLGLTGSTIADPSNYNSILSSIMSDPDLSSGLNELNSQGITDDEILTIMVAFLGGIAVFAVLGAALAVVSLVAGILGVRNYRKPEKLKITFGWSVAGAICAFVSGRWISMVLLIVMAVFIYRIRQAPYNASQVQIGAVQPGQTGVYTQPTYSYMSTNQQGVTPAPYAPVQAPGQVPQQVPQQMPQQVPQQVPEQMPTQVPQQVSAQEPQEPQQEPPLTPVQEPKQEPVLEPVQKPAGQELTQELTELGAETATAASDAAASDAKAVEAVDTETSEAADTPSEDSEANA